MFTEDTQPSSSITNYKDIAPPPRWLLYGVLLIFALSIVMPATGIVVFQNLLRPSQQQRVINNFSFMAFFLPYSPTIDEAVPTPISQENLVSASDLLLDTTPAPTATLITTPTTQATEYITSTTSTSLNENNDNLIQSTPTFLPTTSPSQTPSPEPSTLPSQQVPSSARLYGFTFEQQTWNNCGPASITIALSYYGWQEDQEYARQLLRPDREDKNVTPDELVAFVNQNTGIRALWRSGGTIELVRELLANEFPVILGTGFMPEAYDWIGHYRTVVAYDSAYFYFYDSFMGTGIENQGFAVLANDVDQNWQHFNRRFIVLYAPEREQKLLDILDEYSDASRANEIALETAQQEARLNPQNTYAWFNLGTSLTHLGRFNEAVTAFDRARQSDLPWRMLWYQFEPYQAYFEMGRYDDVLSLAQANLNNGGQYVEETFYWKGMVHEVEDQLTDAKFAYQQALQLNPNYTQAEEALNRVNSTN